MRTKPHFFVEKSKSCPHFHNYIGQDNTYIINIFIDIKIFR